jgi:hypothetical protein
VLAALVPPLRIVYLVLTVGENNLSNDYVGWVPLVSAVLKGSYDWTGFFNDTLAAGVHPMAIPVLIHVAVARVAHWNMSVELSIGLALFLGAFLFLGSALTRSVRGEARWLFWPALSLLIFSTAHLSNFTFGETSLQVGSTFLGFAVGTWGLARFEGGPWTVACMGAGGLLATWSWGGGFLLWPLFGVALAFAERRVVPVVWLGVVCLIAVAPYLRPLLTAYRPPAIGDRTMSFGGFVLQLLGRPFVDDTGTHFGALPYGGFIGIAGIALAAGGVASLATMGREGVRRAFPALMALGFSLAVVVEIAASRRQIAPWYVCMGSLFWAGLLGLWLVLSQGIDGMAHPWSLAGFLLFVAGVGLLGLRENRSWLDKNFYLPSRSPASAACLRAGSAAPPSCEGFVFQWGRGHPDLLPRMARPLRELRLSVFAPRQTWLLQGDQALGRVVFETPPGGQVQWVTQEGAQADFTDPRRLNLRLPAGGRVLWTVPFPKGLRLARFRSEVSLLGAGDEHNAAEVEILDPREGARRIFYFVKSASSNGTTAIDASLEAETGRTVTISLRADVSLSSLGPGVVFVFAIPRIDIVIVDDAPAGAQGDTSLPPSNR